MPPAGLLQTRQRYVGMDKMLEKGSKSRGAHLFVPRDPAWNLQAVAERHKQLQVMVRREVAIAMAEGARERARADYALSLTGIAGPGGGTPEKPVGLVFIALARPGAETLCRDYRFPADRATFKQLASQAALDLLRRELLGI